MSSQKKSNANHESSTRLEITNNSQAKLNSNHASTSGISTAPLETAYNSNHASTSGISTVPLETVNNSHAKPNFPSTTRLSSFLAPRDLTLGGSTLRADKPKKVFTPNLNVQRKKKEEYVELHFY